MAKPQVEDGYLRISAELYDALMRTPFSDYETRVLRAVIRLTYGWRKKKDVITNGRLAQMTGILRPHIAATVRRLMDRQILEVEYGDDGRVLSIQKDYDRWAGSTQARTSTDPRTSTRSRTRSSTQGRTTSSARARTRRKGQSSKGQRVRRPYRKGTDSTDKRSTPRSPPTRKQSPEVKAFLVWWKQHQKERGRRTFIENWHLVQGAIAMKIAPAVSAIDMTLQDAVLRWEKQCDKICDHLMQVERALGRWEMDEQTTKREMTHEDRERQKKTEEFRRRWEKETGIKWGSKEHREWARKLGEKTSGSPQDGVALGAAPRNSMT